MLSRWFSHVTEVWGNGLGNCYRTSNAFRRFVSRHIALRRLVDCVRAWAGGCVYCSRLLHRGQNSYRHHLSHGGGPLVDPFRPHVSRSLFKGLPWFLLPVGELCFIILGNLLRGILFTCCIQFLLYSSNLSKIGVILIPLQFICFVICPSYVIATKNINKTGSARVSNIEALSRNHCSRGRAIRIKYHECVCIYPLFIRHAVRMRLFISSSLVCLALPYFATLSHKQKDFRKKLFTIKCVFWVSIQLLVETFLILRRIQRNITNIRKSSCKLPVICVRF